MKNQVIYEAMGEIDPDLLDEFEEKYKISPVAQGKKGKKWRMLPVVACFTLLLGAGTYYSGLLPQMTAQFAEIWGGSAHQTEMIQHIGYPVDASASSEGITITVDAVMGDESTATVIYSIAMEDGTAFLPPEGVDFAHLYLGSGEYFSSGVYLEHGSYSSTSYFRDFDPEDGTIQYVEILRAKENIPKNTICTANFGEIGYWDEDYTEVTTLLTGQWEIEFRFKYKDISENFPKNEEIVWENETINVTNVSVSPFSLRVDVKFEYGANGDTTWNMDLLVEEGELEEKLENLGESQEEQRKELENLLFEVQRTLFGNEYFYSRVPFFVTLHDGTVIDCDHSGGGHSGDSSVKYSTGYQTFMFEEMMDMAEIQSITYGDYVITVNS